MSDVARPRRSSALLLAAVLTLVLAGCGGSGASSGSSAGKSSSPPAAGALSARDLARDGAFWRAQSAQGKAKLLALAIERDVQEHPGTPADAIRRTGRGLVTGIDEQYADAANRSHDISTAYEDARAEDALGSIDDVTGDLEQSTP